ncbi:MAG: hypothetical protein IMF26_02910 [Candidatus Fermentithermobacillus carboniphilus]|uniref:Uncharacterized protein n=1 Tax=Candidatus Fermentithermobacillus carboniphilus TaxID=3085328 RepID=A0AAT9LD68_9FIRM|nr:MAG: hypothetical protein IMF26_02910 [Candidatus Fermentithermobacillus carboniphilus]
MLRPVLSTFLIFLVLYASMGMRVHRIQSARARKKAYEEASSPLGQAIKDFVAVAGGVYLGLMALAEFLKIPAPVKTELWGVAFDPIAAIAVALAVIAPFLPIRGRNW